LKALLRVGDLLSGVLSSTNSEADTVHFEFHCLYCVYALFFPSWFWEGKGA